MKYKLLSCLLWVSAGTIQGFFFPLPWSFLCHFIEAGKRTSNFAVLFLFCFEVFLVFFFKCFCLSSCPNLWKWVIIYWPLKSFQFNFKQIAIFVLQFPSIPLIKKSQGIISRIQDNSLCISYWKVMGVIF